MRVKEGAVRIFLDFSSSGSPHLTLKTQNATITTMSVRSTSFHVSHLDGTEREEVVSLRGDHHETSINAFPWVRDVRV